MYIVLHIIQFLWVHLGPMSLGVELLGYRVCIFSILGDSTTVSQSDCSDLCPSVMHTIFSNFTSWNSQFSEILANQVNGKWYIIVILIFISLINDEGEHHFMFIDHLGFYFYKVQSISCQFFCGVICSTSFTLPYIVPLSVQCAARLFPQSLSAFCILLIVPFNKLDFNIGKYISL